MYSTQPYDKDGDKQADKLVNKQVEQDIVQAQRGKVAVQEAAQQPVVQPERKTATTSDDLNHSTTVDLHAGAVANAEKEADDIASRTVNSGHVHTVVGNESNDDVTPWNDLTKAEKKRWIDIALAVVTHFSTVKLTTGMQA